MATTEQAGKWDEARRAARAAHSQLAQCPDVLLVLAQASVLKNPTMRAEVLEVLRWGFENADDTASDYDRLYAANEYGFAADYPTKAVYWHAIFYASAQSASCYPRDICGRPALRGDTRRWLHARGLLG